MSFEIKAPFNRFSEANGLPLEAGYVYIGEVGLDPVTNPITVYWDASVATAAAQPLRTLGGFPARNGSAAAIFGSENYSITVLDKNKKLIHSTLNANASSTSFVNTVADLRLSTLATSVYVLGHTTAGDGGHGTFYTDGTDGHISGEDDDWLNIVGDDDRLWVRQLESEEIRPQMAGIYPESVDVAAEIEQFIHDSQDGGYTIDGGNKFYRVDSQIDAQQDKVTRIKWLRLDASNGDMSGASTALAAGIIRFGNLTAHPTPYALTAGITGGVDSTFTVSTANSALLTIGKTILMVDDARSDWDAAGATNYSEWHVIKSIDTGTGIVTIDGNFILDYAIGSDVREYNPANKVEANIEILGAGETFNQVAMIATWCLENKINLTATDCEWHGLREDICYGGTVDIHAENSNKAGAGYVYGARGCGYRVMGNIVGHGCRHSYSGGSDSAMLDADTSLRIVGRGMTGEKCIGTDSNDAILDTHAGEIGTWFKSVTGSLSSAASPGDGITVQGDACGFDYAYITNIARHALYGNCAGGADNAVATTNFGTLIGRGLTGSSRGVLSNPHASLTKEYVITGNVADTVMGQSGIGSTPSGGDNIIKIKDCTFYGIDSDSPIEPDSSASGRSFIYIDNLKVTGNGATSSNPPIYVKGSTYTTANPAVYGVQMYVNTCEVINLGGSVTEYRSTDGYIFVGTAIGGTDTNLAGIGLIQTSATKVAL